MDQNVTQPNSVPQQSVSQVQPAGQRKISILLIDDDRLLLNMYARKFDASGFAVDTCQSAPLALEKLKGGFTPDLLIVDIIMPGMDGIQFVREVRNQNLAPRAKVVMLTNESDNAQLKNAGDLRVDGYLIKAITIPSEVVTRVREILSGKRFFADPF